MNFQRRIQFILLLLSVYFPFSSLSNWEVIFTTKGSVEDEKSVGYRGFRLYEGIEYGIVAKELEGDFELYLYNPGDKLIAKGKKKEKDQLIVFAPPLTEEGYKIVIKGKGKEGKFRLILSQRSATDNNR